LIKSYLRANFFLFKTDKGNSFKNALNKFFVSHQRHNIHQNAILQNAILQNATQNSPSEQSDIRQNEQALFMHCFADGHSGEWHFAQCTLAGCHCIKSFY
jgi:hypothetical protein